MDAGFRLVLGIEDNGVGLPTGAALTGGAQQGMRLHSTMLAVIGGEWRTESEPHRFARVRLWAPLRSSPSGWFPVRNTV